MKNSEMYAVGRASQSNPNTVRLVLDQFAEEQDKEACQGRTAAILTFTTKAEAAACAVNYGADFFVVLLSNGILSRVYFGRRILDSLKRVGL